MVNICIGFTIGVIIAPILFMLSLQFYYKIKEKRGKKDE